MSTHPHHGEFTLHALMYIARLIAEQKYDEVLQLGLRRDQADAIRSMTTEEIHEMALSIRSQFLAIHLDPNAFDAAHAVLHRRKGDDNLDHALIRAGARFEMMRELSGMTSEEYAKHRRYYGIADGRGRPPLPSEDVQAAIWQTWLECEEERNDKRRYLAVHAKTQVAVGTIWRLIREWDETGLTPILTDSAQNQDTVSTNQEHFPTTRK